MIRKIVCKILLMLLATTISKAAAQDQPRSDIAPNYSFLDADLGSGKMSSLHGYNVTINHNLTSWLAIALDQSAYFGSAQVPFCFGKSPSTCEVVGPPEISRLFPIMGGLRFQTTRSRFMPYVRALFGFSVLESCPLPGCESKAGFTQDFGGGMQFRVTERRLGWRVEADFLQTHLFGGAQNDFRFSTGPVIFFYKRQ